MMHLGADDITVEHFVLVQEELDVEIFQAVHQTVLQMLLELQNESLFNLLSEDRNAVAVSLLLLRL